MFLYILYPYLFMKLVTDTEMLLVVQKNNVLGVAVLFVVAGVILAAFFDELIAYAVFAAIIIACLFVPYRQQIIADKQAGSLVVSSKALARSSSRSVPISSVADLVVSVHRTRRIRSSSSSSQRNRTQTSVEFYARLNEQAEQVVQFMLPSPSVSSTRVMGVNTSTSIKNYDVLKRLAEFLGVELRREMPPSPMDAIRSVTGMND